MRPCLSIQKMISIFCGHTKTFTLHSVLKAVRARNFGGEWTRLLKIDPVASQKIQPYLSSDESLYWAGRPDPNVVFHSDDWISIPFAILWTAFAVFWEYGATSGNSKSGGRDWFFALWGIPFIAIGVYMVAGRFVTDAWLKRRTYYGLTDRRVLIVQESWKTKTSTAYLEMVPNIECEGNKTGTIWLGPKYPVIAARGKRTRDMSRFSVGDVPIFADIDDVREVYHQILQVREALLSNSKTAPALTYKEFEK